MSKMDRIIKELSDTIRNANVKKTTSYDTTAEVRRVDGDTAWVHIDGGIDETPVRLTVNAKIGDRVQVRVGGGRAWITGNATAPPTDDTRAEYAVEEIGTTNRVIKVVRKAVDAVTRIAGNTAQYFWHTEEGTDTGVHITEIPQEEFLADPDNGGGNLLARSNGIAVRDGLTELAIFGADTARIGQDGGSQVEIQSRSITMKDYDGDPFVEFKDMRDEDGVARVSQYVIPSGARVYHLSSVPVNTQDMEVWVNGTKMTSGWSWDASSYGGVVRFSTDPSSPFTVIYDTEDDKAKAYTFGTRQTGSYGVQSLSVGDNNIASGLNSTAIGQGAQATGELSTAIGRNARATATGAIALGENSTANGANQFVIGNNVPDLSKRFIIGNEGDTAGNIFAIAEGGRVYHMGDGSVSNMSSNITRSSGASVASISMYRYGRVAMLYLSLRYTTSVAAGGDVFTGYLHSFMPAVYTTGVGYYGARSIVGKLETDGTIVVRNASSSAVTLSDGVSIAFTYILA